MMECSKGGYWRSILAVGTYAFFLGCGSPGDSGTNATEISNSLRDDSPRLIGQDSILNDLATVAPSLRSVKFDTVKRGLVLTFRGESGSVDEALVRSRASQAFGPISRSLFIEYYSDDQPLVSDLLDWRQSAREVFRIKGVLSLDLDEVLGKIRVQVDGSVDLHAVRALLTDAGIPESAVDIELREGMAPQIGVRDKSRPTIPAGFQIQSLLNMAYSQLCTLGADVYDSGKYGFITNAHCSLFGAVGTVNNTVMHQNVIPNPVGTELLDPAGFTGGACPPSKVCRYSDAMFVAYGSSSYYSGKQVAETSVIGTTGPGGLLVGSIYSVPTSSNLTSGLPVRKTGRTSGTTAGTVSATCVDELGASGLLYLCQDVVSGYSRPGDSGSPVYWSFDFSGTSPDVYHAGVLWGGDTLSFEYVLSPWYNITMDLGVFY